MTPQEQAEAILKAADAEGLKKLRDLAETLPPYDWQWTTLTGENGPYQSHEDMIEGIAKTVRHSESLGLHAITWNDEDVDGASSVVCMTGNGPTSPLHAQYIAAVKPSNMLFILGKLDESASALEAAEARLSRLSALLDEAEGALGPFNDLHEAFKGRALSSSSVICGSPTKAELTFGAIRRAASVAAAIAQEKSK